MYSKLKNKTLIIIKKKLLLESLIDSKKSYLVYKMRNSKIMRNNSINKRQIKFNTHKKWFDQFILQNKIYLVKYNSKYVGYLRLEFLKFNKIKISIFIKKSFQNKNIASKILKFALVKFKKYKFIAKVLKSNQISQSFFKKNGFKISDPKRRLFVIS
tara:strand:+ start:1244 stop:1714 length:471 start_codon:yes stop_codon:yes gene_type:complete